MNAANINPTLNKTKKDIEANNQTYKRRQAIVEHPYGIIKRQWGFYYVTTKKGIRHASADVGLMFVAFNLRRLMNIIDKTMLTKFLKELVSLFFQKTALLKAIRTVLRSRNFLNHQFTINYNPIYISLKLNYI